MSRISRGYLSAGRNAPAVAAPVPSALLRRGKALAGVEGEETLDLFSKSRGGCLFSSSGGSDVLNIMEKKASSGLAKAGRGAADEFLSVEVGKHDYDWLLTPPGTPLFSSVDSTDHLPSSTSQRSSSNLRPASLVKTSRLSGPLSEKNSHCPRMARSSSTSRASFSTSSRTPSSVLNTSTASVNSRPATPNARGRAPATITPRTTAPRAAASRSTTPSRTHSSSIEKPATQTFRPSTPNSKAHFPASTVSSSLNSTQTRPSIRASTPTRRPPPPATNSRPSSPTPMSRAQTQPIVPTDYPFNTPPNLRTKLSERAISTGRQRPGIALTVKGNSNMEAAGSGVSSSRRASSPAGARGPVVDNQAKGRVYGCRDNLKLVENQKPMVPERKLVKPSPGAELGGYGRIMSKNSLNMALKHMDIRQGTNSVRGASLFPHSIRSATTATLKDRSSSRQEPMAAAHKNKITDYGGYHNERMAKTYNESSESRDEDTINNCEVGPTMKAYGSFRYDSILLKEDSKSLNWLRSLDEKPDDQSHPFERSRFEPLPEPFILL